MKTKIIFSLFIFILLLSSGANVNAGSLRSEIVIYRSAEPDWRFQKIEIVVVRGISDIGTIYEKMRIAARESGADAVIEFNMEAHEETVADVKFICSAKMPCYPVNVYRKVVSYIATGVLVRKMEEGQ
jgi:hypothetical protein